MTAQGGSLRVAGGPALVPIGKNSFRNPRGDLFFMSQDEFELRFLSKDRFELKSMEGKTARYRRAQLYSPTAADLRAFAGQYGSDEIGSVFRIEPGRDGLMVRLEHSPATTLEFKPVDRDTFQIRRVTVRFRRDGSGKVVGLDYSNPVLRKVPFTRLSDRSGSR